MVIIFVSLFLLLLAGAEGMITALTYYNNFTSDLPNKATVIWLGETTQTNLTDGWIPSTSLTEVFNGTLSSGVYFYRLISNDKIVDTKRVLLLK